MLQNFLRSSVKFSLAGFEQKSFCIILFVISAQMLNEGPPTIISLGSGAPNATQFPFAKINVDLK